MITSLNRTKGRLIRDALMELRTSGIEVKEAAGIIGVTNQTAWYHWGLIRRRLGNVPDVVMAAWAVTTPRHLWEFCIALIICVSRQTVGN